MKDPKLFKKIDIMLKKKKDLFIVFSVIFVILLGVIYKTRESYAIETFTGNRMNTFPSTITDHKDEISAVYFINSSQANIDSRYNASSIKADLTYYSTGSVKGWLETDTTDSTKYILYVGSNGKTYLTTGSQLFYRWKNVKKIDFSNVDTSNVKNMSQMFLFCSKLNTLDLSNFDTSNVTNMTAMFHSCYCLKSINLSSFDTSKVMGMSFMFYYCYALSDLDLSNFDVSHVTNMENMFSNTDKPTKFKSINIKNEIIKITIDTMLVKNLKRNTFNLVKSVTNNNVEKLDTVKLATGDSATFNSKTYDIAVVGDTNGDGNVTLIDVMQVARHVYTSNKLTGCYLEASDYNNDGAYNLSDVMQIAKKVYS